MSLTPTEKYDLIVENLQEVINGQIIKDILESGKPLKVYWGTAPTGKPHCGYLVAMTKIAHFLHAGCEVTVLLADLHAFLDNMKAPLEVVEFRVQYYQYLIKAILTSIGVSIDKLKFVVGRSYQTKEQYVMDLFKLSNVVSQNSAKRAGAEVVKQVDNPLLSGLIYPLMQALDEEHLGVDAQFGGVDQRKIFMLAEENLPSIGYKKRAHLMNPMVPGLGQGGKMSASDPNSKIDLLEEPAVVRKKISKAYAAPGEVEGNGLIGFLEYATFPIYKLLKGEDAEFVINRPEKYGGKMVYKSIEQLKQEYAEQKLSPQDLKIGVADAINELLAPIRDQLIDNEEFLKVEKLAYHSEEPATQKKKKKEKKIGTKFPGLVANAAPKDDKDDVEDATKKLADTNI